MEGDGCFLCKSARRRLDEVIHELDCLRGIPEDGPEDSCQLDYDFGSSSPSPAPILLGHFPLFRANDAHCDEPDEASKEEKIQKFRPKWDCLSEESTKLLLTKLRPRLVLTGHTHHGCRTKHENFSSEKSDLKDKNGQNDFKNEVKNYIEEWSVSSFSWRNRDNPAFLLAEFSSESLAVEKCVIPRESTIINFYWASLFLTFYLFLKRSWCFNKRQRFRV